MFVCLSLCLCRMSTLSIWIPLLDGFSPIFKWSVTAFCLFYLFVVYSQAWKNYRGQSWHIWVQHYSTNREYTTLYKNKSTQNTKTLKVKHIKKQTWRNSLKSVLSRSCLKQCTLEKSTGWGFRLFQGNTSLFEKRNLRTSIWRYWTDGFMLWPRVLLLHIETVPMQLTPTKPNRILYIYVRSALKRLNSRLSKFSFANLQL